MTVSAIHLRQYFLITFIRKTTQYICDIIAFHPLGHSGQLLWLHLRDDTIFYIFRKFIKDADKQREIEEEESLAGAGGGSERAIARAKERFLEAPDIAENVNRYGTMLRREGTTESLVEAEKVFMKGFKSNN